MTLHVLPVPDSDERVQFEINGLHFAPGITYDEWCAAGKQARLAARAGLWWLGDWMVYGTMTFGDEHVDAQIDPADLALGEGTIRSAQWVSERIPPLHRRMELSWSHHREVASLPPTTRDRWLDTAVTDGLSTRELRELVQAEKNEATEDAMAERGTVTSSARDDDETPDLGAGAGSTSRERAQERRTGDDFGDTWLDAASFKTACEMRFGLTLGADVQAFVLRWSERNARAARNELDS